jgi:hypothetical protein
MDVDGFLKLNLKSWDEVIHYMETAITEAKKVMSLAEEHKRKGIPFPTGQKAVQIEIGPDQRVS